VGNCIVLGSLLLFDDDKDARASLVKPHVSGAKVSIKRPLNAAIPASGSDEGAVHLMRRTTRETNSAFDSDLKDEAVRDQRE
jgi:hypothetical protein